jgi:hypothetical protein
MIKDKIKKLLGSDPLLYEVLGMLDKELYERKDGYIYISTPSTHLPGIRRSVTVKIKL